MSKTLVAYMSVSGQTKCLAKSLAEAAHDANLYEIKPKAPYTSDDLNYRNKESRCTIEMTVPGWRPELSEIIDTSTYNTIFVGFPIWWGKAPTLVNSFLESIVNLTSLYLTGSMRVMSDNIVVILSTYSNTVSLIVKIRACSGAAQNGNHPPVCSINTLKNRSTDPNKAQ